MPNHLEELYVLGKNDTERAALVLKDAFRDDPIWNALFADVPDKEAKLIAFYEMPLLQCMKYGAVYATSESLEGVAAWVPGRYSYVNAWRTIRSGALLTGLKMGMEIGKKMQVIFTPMEDDRKRHMQGRRFMYLQIIGVARDLQGKGHGGRLIRALLEHCKQGGLPLYLETETEDNVNMYKKFGFQLLKTINLSVIDLPMWEMVREA